MAIKNGTSIGFYVGGVKVAGCTSADISRSMSTRDTTSKDSAGWAGNGEGLREWSASGEGFFDLAAAYGFTDLEAAYVDRTLLTIRVSTETSGEEYSEGQAYLASLEATSGVEESATFSFEVTGTGELNYVQLT